MHLEGSYRSSKEGLVVQMEARIMELEDRLESEERCGHPQSMNPFPTPQPGGSGASMASLSLPALDDDRLTLPGGRGHWPPVRVGSTPTETRRVGAQVPLLPTVLCGKPSLKAEDQHQDRNDQSPVLIHGPSASGRVYPEGSEGVALEWTRADPSTGWLRFRIKTNELRTVLAPLGF